MILHLHPYAPHRDTRIETADAGLYVVSGLNGSGKSTLVEAYAAACWGRSLRGASAWRSDDCRIDLALPGLTVERTPNTLRVNGEAALTPAKTQQRLASIVGDFATWQRTRVFDADLTARFGASGDGERKKLLEQLLGLEKLDAGLRRCRAALREAEQHAAEMAKEAGRLQQEKTAADRALELFHSGHCPTCAQAVSTEHWLRVRDAAAQALSAQTQAQRAAVQDVTPLLAQVRELRATQATAERAAQAEARRAELLARRTEAATQRAVHETTLRRLRAVEAFIVQARPKLLASSLAILQEAASAWLPGLSIGEDMVVRHGQRTYKELNEGHRRLCDMAVLLGLSGMGDAKVKGPIFLDGALHGLDEDRQDAVATLLETVAQRELVIVLTCVEETAQRLCGTRLRIVDGEVQKR